MDGKPFDKLNETDQVLKRLFPPEWAGGGTQVRIELVQGFELFNTRPYHNYETFSHGYYVEVPGRFKFEHEDLDVCLEQLKLALKCEHINKSRSWCRDCGVRLIEDKEMA